MEIVRKDFTLEELNLTRPLYTINEVLALLPIGRTSIHYAMVNGHLRATKVGKKKVVFTAFDLAKFISKMRNNEIKDIKKE